jgi:hypothetical protein
MTTEDKIVPPVLQRFMAERAKAKIVEQASSHAVMLSHPDSVVRVIESAAGALSSSLNERGAIDDRTPSERSGVGTTNSR